ncbi:DUF4179 domain-containing protein [Lysinibacillus sp. LZ02]|uniref:DUF4179 domain-containing protein n=1 Tax=Lysinibacillus sp. LZ02 TaxID=3420668 RepID=UPI003D36E3F1
MTSFDAEKLNKDLNQIKVPKDQLAKTRQIAFTEVQKEKHRANNWRYYTVLTATVALALILSIRYIPLVADTAKRVPGFADVVSFITDDQKHDYEELNITETKNDLTLTVKGVIADETGMKIHYALEAPYNISELPIKKVTILQDGKEIDGSATYGWSVDGEEKKYVEDVIYKFVEGEDLPNQKNFELQITFGDKESTTFEIPFTIKNDVVKKRIYNIKRNLSYEGQKLIVEDVTVTPTATRLRITAANSNSMQILSLGNIRILNEQGEPFNTLEGGLISLGVISSDEVTYLFDSTVLEAGSSLTIEIENMNVLPKDDNYIEVDFIKQEVLKQPAIGNVTFEVKQDSLIKIDAEEGKEVRLSHAIDANGKRFEMESLSGSWNQVEYTYPPEMKNPVKIYFYDYPNTLHFKEEIVIYE